MASLNPFDLLVDDDNEDPNQLVSAQRATQPLSKKTSAPAPAKTQPVKSEKFPSKPLPPAQAVREAKNGDGRGRGRGNARGFGQGRGGGVFSRDAVNNENNAFGGSNGFSERHVAPEGGKAPERHGNGGPHGSFRDRRRGGEAEEGERPRRMYERHSGTGRGNEFKRDGAGRRNWGTPADDIAPDVEDPTFENEKNVAVEPKVVEDAAIDENKEDTVKEPEETAPEDKEMTLKEYEKIREESRKQLAMKTEVRKVDVDEELGSMLQLSSKKTNDEFFIKLGSEKDKRKDNTDKDEKAKKSVTINEFLKPAEGERYYNPGGRGGRGRGRGSRGVFNGSNRSSFAAPSIEDPGHFPSLSAK